MFIEIIRDREDKLTRKKIREDEEARIKRREQFLNQVRRCCYDNKFEFLSPASFRSIQFDQFIPSHLF